MPFDLPNSFLTGIERIDSDHKALVARINSVAAHEQSKDRNRLLAALAHFMADLADHFHWEEQMLKEMNYPQLESHTKHHAEAILALDRLIRSAESGTPFSPSVAHVCFDRLIAAVLMTDMEFANWFSANPTHGNPLIQQ
jgi:hemerythrin